MKQENKNKEEQKKMEDVSIRKEKGITLIALVITIIVLLILAGVTINLTIGERGIFTTAQNAAKNYTNEQNKELAGLDAFDEEVTGAISILGTGWNETKKVNAPQLADGLIPVIISDNGEITQVSQYDSNWYDYENRKWANAQSKDGSLWVWIPRYAYKIIKPTEEQSSGTIEVVFLKGTSNSAENSNLTIKKATEVSGDWENGGQIDGEETYIVHPAFCDGSAYGYPNGEWDAEIPGFWVAKFEAGFAGGTNGNNATKSNVIYKQPIYKNYYNEWPQDLNMYYPASMPCRVSYNYVSISDAYELSLHLNDEGNPYGFNKLDIDSHLIKNSEWGALAYLAYSSYGTNGKEISINNVMLANKLNGGSITGYGQLSDNNAVVDASANYSEWMYSLKEGNWLDVDGVKASTTFNVSGVYDTCGRCSVKLLQVGYLVQLVGN